MEIELNLDALTERYVQSMERKVEAYRARTWTLFIVGVCVGFLAGMFFTVQVVGYHGTLPLSEASGSARSEAP